MFATWRSLCLAYALESVCMRCRRLSSSSASGVFSSTRSMTLSSSWTSLLFRLVGCLRSCANAAVNFAATMLMTQRRVEELSSGRVALAGAVPHHLFCLADGDHALLVGLLVPELERDAPGAHRLFPEHTGYRREVKPVARGDARCLALVSLAAPDGHRCHAELHSLLHI